MKKLLPLLFLWPTLLPAQDSTFQVNISNGFEIPAGTTEIGFLPGESGLINLSILKNEQNLTLYEMPSLREINTTVFPLERLKNFQSEGLTHFKGSDNFWIYSDWNKEDETDELSAERIFVENGKLTITPKRLFKGPRLIETSHASDPSDKGDRKYKYQLTEDYQRTRLLVSFIYRPAPFTPKPIFDSIGLRVFDKNLDTVRTLDMNLPYSEDYAILLDELVDSQSNIYLLLKVYDNDSKKERIKKTGKAGYHLEVLKYAPGLSEPQIDTVSVGEGFIRQEKLVELSNHEILVSATYGKDPKDDLSMGIFLARLTGHGTAVPYYQGYYEIPHQTVQANLSLGELRRLVEFPEFQVAHLILRDLIHNADGSLLVVAEQAYITVTSYSGMNNASYTSVHWNFENIYCMLIGAEGSLKWARKIPKLQEGTSGRGNMGYQMMQSDSGYYFVFMDKASNLNIGPNDAPDKYKDGKKGQLVVTRIDPAGELSRSLLFDTKDQDILIFPAELRRLRNNWLMGRVQAVDYFFPNYSSSKKNPGFLMEQDNKWGFISVRPK